jgi:hypothetical protein
MSGCTSIWVTTPGPQSSAKIGVSADLPAGWARYTPGQGLMFTKDGALLQSIVVTRDKYDTKLENTDRKLTKGMEPQEAAQTLLDGMAADQGRHHLQVVDNRPATVGGLPGFRLEVTYKTAEGLTMHETLYVALTGDSYVVVKFTAPHRYFQERHAGEFEKVVASLKIEDKPARS